MGNNPTHEQQKPMLETALTMGTILTDQVGQIQMQIHSDRYKCKYTVTNTP